jgi:hypothetical protein
MAVQKLLYLRLLITRSQSVPVEQKIQPRHTTLKAVAVQTQSLIRLLQPAAAELIPAVVLMVAPVVLVVVVPAVVQVERLLLAVKATQEAVALALRLMQAAQAVELVP